MRETLISFVYLIGSVVLANEGWKIMYELNILCFSGNALYFKQKRFLFWIWIYQLTHLTMKSLPRIIQSQKSKDWTQLTQHEFLA